MGAQGLWYGFSLGYLPAVAMYLLILCSLDWQIIID